MVIFGQSRQAEAVAVVNSVEDVHRQWFHGIQTTDPTAQFPVRQGAPFPLSRLTCKRGGKKRTFIRAWEVLIRIMRRLRVTLHRLHVNVRRLFQRRPSQSLHIVLAIRELKGYNYGLEYPRTTRIHTTRRILVLAKQKSFTVISLVFISHNKSKIRSNVINK